MSYSRKSNYSHHRSYGILTIDIGTSGCKAILFGNDGTIISKAEKLYSFNYDDKTGCAEQNPDEIYKSFVQVIKKYLSKEGDSLRYIILGSVLHSLVLLDEKGVPYPSFYLGRHEVEISMSETKKIILSKRLVSKNWFVRCLPRIRFLSSYGIKKTITNFTQILQKPYLSSLIFSLVYSVVIWRTIQLPRGQGCLISLTAIGKKRY